MKKVLWTILFFITLIMLAVRPIFGSEYQKTGPTSTLKKSGTQKKLEKVEYTCTKHPEITMFNAGKCPICNNDLIKKSVSKVIYICPVHQNVVSYKQGKCPKCGMPLVKSTPMKVSA